MPRTGYQDQLETLREDVVRMGEEVVARLRMAILALDRQDHDLAWEVIDGDDDINRRYLDLERDCIDLVALQQPVASDLRLVAASFKIITDLERVGDLATNLGEYALYGDREVFDGVDLRDLGEAAAELVTDAVAAYDDADATACEELAERDADFDRQCERASELVVRDLIETELPDSADSEAVEHLLQEVSKVLLTIRDFERVGDHAVNIAARTLYMVENDDRLIE